MFSTRNPPIHPLYRCLEYGKKGESETAVSIFPLNPFMFLPRPLWTDRHVHTNILHMPYWLHLNWAAGESDKVKVAQDTGMWLYKGAN